MKKLRLLLFDDCDRDCAGCCNKQWDLDKVPLVESYVGYDEVMITGGEPMLAPMMVITTALSVRRENPTCKILLYTAKSKRAEDILAVLHVLDGLTLTLHEPYDVKNFLRLNDYLCMMRPVFKGMSFRLNVFKGVHVDPHHMDLSMWVVKDNMEWIENCPLPENETFMRLI